MAITRLRQTGAETGDRYEIDGVAWYIGDRLYVETDDKYTDSYSYKLDLISLYWTYAYINFTATAQMRVGCWTKITAIPGGYYDVFKIRDTSGELVQVKCSTSGSQLLVNGTAQDTGGSYFGSWTHIGIDVKVHSTNGWVYVYRNGSLDMSFDGNTGTLNANQFRFGKHVATNYTYTQWVDDIFIDDTTGESSPAPLPLLRFVHVRPSGNGNYAQWIGSDGDSTDNYLLVDEVPVSTSDYVNGTSTDDMDSYNMYTYSLADGEVVRAVIPMAVAKRHSSTEQIALGTRLSSIDSVGSDQTPSGTYTSFYERQTTKPGGGSWEQADIDGMELVLKARGAY